MHSWSYPYPVQYLDVNDTTRLAYVECGKGPETLIFLHGLGSNLKAWQKNMEVLSKRYRCIALDLPGYGKSSQQAYPFTMAFFAQAVNTFVELKKIKRPILVGHSMGGQVAITANLLDPAYYKQLILIAPAGFETFSAAQRNWFATFYTPAVVKATSDEQIVKNFALNFHAMPADAQFMIDDRMTMKADSAAYNHYCNMIPQCVQGMLNGPVFDQLSQLQPNTLVLYGAEDALIPNTIMHPELTTLQVAQTGTDAIPNAQLTIIPEAGHFVQWEQAEAINQRILDFLR